MPAGNSCGHFLTATLQQFLIVLPVDDITAAVGRLPLVTIFPLRREEVLHDGSDHAAMSDDRKMKTERADAPSVLVYLPDPLEFILSMQPSDGFDYHFSPTRKKKTTSPERNLSFFGPSDWIRTSGLLNPIQARYQTSPHPDIFFVVCVTASRLAYINTGALNCQPLF